MVNKGIVMDMKKQNVVVLTPKGEFITFKRKVHSYMIGEEISFNEQEQKVPRFSIFPFLKPASLLVACFLCVFLFVYNQPEEKAFAYVSVDINPSLEASVTKDLSVIDIRACNDDGKRIQKEMKQWKKEHLKDVIRNIIKQSQEDKYLTNDKPVTLTAVTKDKSLESELEKAMQELKKEYDIKHVTVLYQNSTMEMREKAMKAGVGTGVYIKQENEKKKLLTPPAPPSNQEENHEEVHSQPKSSPDTSSDLPAVKEKKYEKQEQKEQKEQKQTEEQPPKQIKENNGNQQGNNGRGPQQENNENQQGNNGRGPQKGNNENQQGNNGRGPQKENNENQQGNNGRGPQKENNENQQGNNGRGPQKENNENLQGNSGRGPQKENNENQQGNNGRGPQQENNGNHQGNNGRGPENED
ncbi:anti-sigma factor domain-containing protein [Bacillus luti]